MKLPSLVAVGFVGLTLVAMPALAQRSPDAGAELAVRTGIALPFGSIQSGTSLDSYASSAVPLVIEAGYRFDSSLFLGGRFQYAFPQLKNPNGGCGGNVSCTGSVVQVGLEGTYRFVPAETFAPWLGLGFGYEWAGADYDAPNIGAGATDRGFAALVQGGGDIRVTPQLVLGPFVEAWSGRFDSATSRVRLGNGTTESTADITNTAWHTWVTVGVRGAFRI